jgi:hypothetical protein
MAERSSMNDQAPSSARRKISSEWTAFYSFVFPATWIIFFLCVALSLGWPRGWIVTPIMIFGLLITYVLGGRLRVVHVDDRFLYVSNYRRQVQIPLSDVSKITENVLINVHPVTLHLSTPSSFGTRIRFMPKTWQVFFFGSHPVVAELTELVAKATQIESGKP